MITDKSDSLARARRRSFAWFVLLALVFVALAVIGQLPLLSVVALGLLPLGVGLWLARTGTRAGPQNVSDFELQSRRARASGSVSVPVSLDRTRELIREAVADLRDFTVTQESGDQIEVAVRWSLRSWGEYITLKLYQENRESTQVTGEVRPKIGTNVIDFGQGADDLATLFSELRRRAL